MPTVSDPRPLSQPTVEFEGVSVKYRLPHERVSGLKEYTIRWLQRRLSYEEFWALKDVSFTVQPGEVFGVIGRNGAGKSTLLKVMARVLAPTRGRVVLRGRLAPLLELGGGFHQELSGRENVYLNGALLGYSREEIATLLPAILDFAEIHDFIDAPLRTYSTGMVARLGFSVATCIRPDILLVDEVLSVGDSRFQEKCLDRMGEFRRQGTTIIIVSHSMATIEIFCKRALWLESGQTQALGPSGEVIERYVSAEKAKDPAAFVEAAPVRVIPPPQLVPPPDLDAGGFFALDDIGDYYPAADLMDVSKGSITLRFKVRADEPKGAAVLFHTDDSRWVLYISPENDRLKGQVVQNLVARTGGNQRVIDTYFGVANFPEISFALDETNKEAGVSKGEWHTVVLTWQGYPEGAAQLWVDGEAAGETRYDSRFDNGLPLPAYIGVGVRPSIWTGELVQKEDGSVADSRPTSTLPVAASNLEMRDLRLYRRALTPDEIRSLSSSPIISHS